MNLNIQESTIALIFGLFLLTGLIVILSELKTGKKDLNLRKRFISALVMVPLALAAIYFGGMSFLIFIFLAAALSIREFLRLVDVWKYPAYRNVAIVSTGLIFSAAAMESTGISGGHAHTLTTNADFHPFYAALVPAIMLVLAIPLCQRAYQGMVIREVTTVFAILYFGWFLGHVVLLRNLEGGLGLTLFFLIVVACNDIGAYASGRAFGQHKLISEISPKKTWEGFLGGLTASVIAALIFQYLVPTYLSTINVLIAAALISIAGPFGDLVVSVVKRDMQAKDSSDLIPGHGGLLDRSDSLIFSAPNFFYFVLLVNLYQ